MSRGLSLLLAALAQASALSGCSAPSKAISEPAAIPAEALVAAPQDQRIELALLAVGEAENLLPRGPGGDVGESPPARLHSEEQMARVASDGAHDVRSCATAAESTDQESDIAGALVVHLEIDSAGLVLGGTTTPRGGETGLAAVADCLLAAARQWRFPGRATPGSTILVIPYRID